ncbi:MAG: PqqD family peptide modification chaperone [Deltaproteobacteria bacterium]|nr:PqqD family peptide modification chaperone [Deltaproteobacteria bacterium]
MLNKAVPIYQKDAIVFYREEKDGFMTVLLKDSLGGMKLLNATSRNILDLCDGSNSVAQIHSVLKDRFPQETSNTLLRDLKQALMIMTSENLVRWKDDQNPFLLNQSLFEVRHNAQARVYRATENDFNQITDFVKKATAQEQTSDDPRLVTVIASSFIRARIFNDLILRSRMFNFTERIYFLEQEGDKIGMLSVLDDFPMSRRGLVNLLTLTNEHNVLEDILYLLGGAISDVKKHISKLKCSLFTDQPDVDNYGACLQKAGFVREGVLKSEYASGINEWLYGKIL